MNILCVSHYFASHGGGVERVAGRLLEQLADDKCRMIWAATGEPSREEARSFRTVVLRAWNGTERAGLPFPVPHLGSLRQLWRQVRDNDLVLVHEGMYLTSIAAVLFARLHKRPVILVQHVGRVQMTSRFLSVMMRIIDRLVVRPMLRRADRVVFISATTAQHFGTECLSAPAALIFNGVDSDVFSPEDGIDRKARSKLMLPCDKPVALFVGRFVEKKGILRLRRLAERRPDIHWAFAGWGPIDPAGWGLSNVSVHRGLAGVTLASLYRAVDLLVLPSSSEGFPLVVQEALACGLRVACCEDAAFADGLAAPFLVPIEIDPNGEEGTLVRIERAVELVLSLDDSVESRRERARFAAQRYSWREAGQRHVSLARELAEATRWATFQRGGAVG